jgi:dTDP-4-amino-4,6-dideoxygalactose transaminase
MKEINAFGKIVVEDAVHCMPSKYDGKWIGDTNNLCAFSFYATKNITTGEGGMLTGPTELLDRARMMALHGMSRGAWQRFAKGGSFEYDVPQPGFKYNMTDIASSIGLVQLRRLDELYAKRMEIVRFYDEAFKGFKYLHALKVKPGRQSAHHLYSIQLNLETLKIDRNQFYTEMAERNIGCSVHYKPVHLMSYYSKKYNLKPSDFPNATAVYERLLALPLSSRMTTQDAADVVEAVQDVCKKFAK